MSDIKVNIIDSNKVSLFDIETALKDIIEHQESTLKEHQGNPWYVIKTGDKLKLL